jgi:hypothetical protein
MGNFSRDTFDKLKHYVGVRLQQGVPILDADWNEMEDIRKYELRAFLKWFVGNGVPRGSDGFRIGPPEDGRADDFSIAPGICLVDGCVVINEEREAGDNWAGSYRGQRLFKSGDLPKLSRPIEPDRVDTVYLDVWEREVDATDDPDLINQAIGIETAVRLKREWVVRVAEYAIEPPPAGDGHVFYPLAHLRPIGPGGEAPHIVDRRRTGLTLSPDEIKIRGGNVGIGTEEIDNYRLVIKQAESRSNHGLRIINKEGDRSGVIWVGSGGIAISAEGEASLQFYTGGTSRLWIGNDGRTIIREHLSIGPISWSHVETSPKGVGSLTVTGADAGLGFLRRDLKQWSSANPKAGDRYVWYNKNGNALLRTDQTGDLLRLSSSGELTILRGPLAIQGSPRVVRITTEAFSDEPLIERANRLNLIMDEQSQGTRTPYWNFRVGHKKDGEFEESFRFVQSGHAYKSQGTSWDIVSDRKLKKNIEPIKGALETISRLRGVCFQWKETGKFGCSPGTYRGLVAQEVEEVIPEWVVTDDAGLKSISMHGFEALVVEAFRELKHQSEELHTQVGKLEEYLVSLEKKIRTGVV